MEAIKNEQEYVAFYKNEDTGEYYEQRKMFLLSDIRSIEDCQERQTQQNDPRPKTFIIWKGNYSETCIICPYEIFKDKWLKYRKQNNHNNIFSNQ